MDTTFGNGILRHFKVKRGLAIDLAKLTHSLDLSSPHLAVTLNSSLKALEILSKVAGCNLHFQKGQDKKKENNENLQNSEDPSANTENGKLLKIF